MAANEGRRGRAARRARLAGLVALALVAGACRGCPSGSPPIHLNPNMDEQPKLLPFEESAFFADGKAMRAPVEGTVAIGELAADEAFVTGKQGGAFLAEAPLAADPGVLVRGERQYGIYCLPCHGEQADGRGMLYRRAGVESADLLDPRIQAMPAGQIFDVITNGFGLMGAYGPVMPAADRWAVVAWLRSEQAAAGTRNPAADAAAMPEGTGPEEGMQNTLGPDSGADPPAPSGEAASEGAR